MHFFFSFYMRLTFRDATFTPIYQRVFGKLSKRWVVTEGKIITIDNLQPSRNLMNTKRSRFYGSQDKHKCDLHAELDPYKNILLICGSKTKKNSLK